MLISTREAVALLAAVGVGRHSAERLLRSGLAGPPTMSTSARLYEHEQVAALLRWPRSTPEDLWTRFGPFGLLTVRWEPGLSTAQGGAAARLRLQPLPGIWARVAMAAPIRAAEALPVVAVAGDFVVRGYDATAMEVGDDNSLRVSLAEPDGWFDEVRERRLPMRHPGRSWSLVPTR